MVELYHVNFHTFQNQSLFLVDEYADALAHILDAILARHHIVCLAWTVMPNHAHFVVAAFPDQPRERIVQLIKGGSAYDFFQRYPEIGAELGGHVWQRGYDWVEIRTHRQLQNAIAYVEANRPKIGLPPMATEINPVSIREALAERPPSDGIARPYRQGL